MGNDMNQAEIARRLAELPGHLGVYICDTGTGETFAHQAEDPIEAASVIKLTVMAEAFRQFEAGELNPDELVEIKKEQHLPSCGALSYLHDGIRVTWKDLVTLMIILSDNTATNILIDKLGIEKINAGIAHYGLVGTQLNRKLFQPHLARQGIKNYVSAAGIGRLMHLLMEGKVVSEEASKEMLRIMGDQRLNGKMPFHLHDKGIRCAHKTGEDDGVTHDAGVIWADKPVIFVFLSEKTDVPAAERLLQDLAAHAAGTTAW